MKVFRVVADPTYAGVEVLDDARSLDDEIVSYPLAEWSLPAVALRVDGKSRGNFLDAGRSALVFDTQARDSFGSIFEAAGQIFDLNVASSEPLHLLNVREVCNALDRDRSQMLKTADGATYDISDFVFHTNRVGTFSSLFKLPELGYRDLLTHTDAYAQEDHDDFYKMYRSSGLTGLSFEEIWSD